MTYMETSLETSGTSMETYVTSIDILENIRHIHGEFLGDIQAIRGDIYEDILGDIHFC
jgi:hypothetical protein